MQLVIKQHGGDKKEFVNYRKAANFFMGFLLGETELLNLNKLNIEFLCLSKNYHGFCHYETEDNWIEATIQIHRHLPFVTKIVTLAHECIHIKQHIRNDYGINDQENDLGSSTDYPFDDYMNLPWEKEAHRLDKVLALKYFERELK